MFFNRTIILIIIGLVVVAGGVLLYFYYPRGEAPAATGDEGAGQSELATGKIKRISQGPVLGVAVTGQKVKYYSSQNGNVFESDFDGSGAALTSPSVLLNLLKVLWSYDKSKVIAIFEQNGQDKKYSYDYKTGLSTPLDDNIDWISWSPKEDKIAYQYYNPQTEENNISVANPDGTNWTNIFQTRMKDLIVEWPKSDQVAIRTRPSGLAQSDAYVISLSQSALEKVISQAYGLTLLWSPLGDKVLYSETNNQGKKLKLKLLNLNTKKITEIALVTLPEKCAWSGDNKTIFCAVPQEISNFAILPDDYYKKTVSFDDNFWRINTDEERTTPIYSARNEETAAYDAKNLLLSPLEDYLLFINQKDGRLYSLPL